MAAWNSNGLTVRLAATSPDTVLLTDDVVIYTGTGAKAAAIPGAGDASVQRGKVYRFSNANTGAVTFTPASGQIDNGATKVLIAGTTTVPTTLTVVSDGTQWRSITPTPA